MSGPFSDIILSAGGEMTPERRALLLRLANADGQGWIVEPVEFKNFTEHTAEIMYGDLANEVEKLLTERTRSLTAEADEAIAQAERHAQDSIALEAENDRLREQYRALVADIELPRHEQALRAACLRRDLDDARRDLAAATGDDS